MMPDPARRNATSDASNHTYIVLLNWNGWRDTVECVASLLKLHATSYSIVICDNASTDGSYRNLVEWLQREALLHAGPQQFFSEWDPASPVAHSTGSRVVLVQTGSNRGFAGGCNVGLRYGLERGDGKYFWLLNNDTVVDPEALTAQIAKMESDPQLGITGSTILFYDNPDTVQCCAGYGFNFWTARVRPLPLPVSPTDLPSESSTESYLRYISGASMFARRSFLLEVGLMNEQYFLYFEEIDWAVRAEGKFTLGYCSASRILHKEGRSIGSSRENEKRSATSERWLSRNRILFTRSHFPLRLPVTLLWTSSVAISRLLQGDISRALTVFISAWGGLFAPAKSPTYPSVRETR